MIQPIDHLPTNVFGYAVQGLLHASDYDILRPALAEYALQKRGKLHLLVDVSAATGLGTKSFWEEAKLQWNYAGEIGRVAVVGPPEWTKPFIKIAGMIRIGGEIETFSKEQTELAQAWLAGLVAV